MPLLVWLLGFGIVVQGTSELMMAGLLPEVATDLAVPVPQAGLLVAGFAVGMVVGAPVLAVLTRRWPRRAALVGFVVVFAGAHVLGATAPSYPVLMASRVLGAFVYAGYWVVALVVAVAAVPDGMRGRAIGIVSGGLTLAVLVGLPAGTWLGQVWGWRSVFWLLTAVSLALAVALLVAVPHRRAARPDPGAGSLRTQLRAVTRPAVLLAYATISLSIGALLVVYTYLAPMIVDAMGLAPRWVPVVLAGYGVGALLGVVVGGRGADRAPSATLLAGLGAFVVVSAALALFVSTAAVAVALVVLLGALGFGVNPALHHRALTLAPGAPTLAAAGNTLAFNVGISLAPWLGGALLDGGAGYPSLAWAGAAVALAAVAAAAASTRVAPPVPREVAVP